MVERVGVLSSCACHPAPPPALPSELLEPALGGAFGLCLRQLMRSSRTDADYTTLVEQCRALMRVALCNRTDGSPNGVHADLAASNLLSMVERLRDSPPAVRDGLLDGLTQYGA